MSEIIWQLPVRQSNRTDHDWVHPRAKYHAFLEGESLCGKFRQDTNYFETTIDASELLKNKTVACKRCLQKQAIAH